MPLLNTPNGLIPMRQSMFDLAEPLELTVAKFDTFFPFVSNVWAISSKQGSRQYYRCRLGRTTQAKKKHADPKLRRDRTQRTVQCDAAMVVITTENGVTVQRTGGIHTHTLDDCDK